VGLGKMSLEYPLKGADIVVSGGGGGGGGGGGRETSWGERERERWGR